ncbi:MAG TPA: efflux RND transporter periplasmic adaptor subunit [Syntrophales bacterium]|nr:efflux RND transporter periplasmic adaptor subunit [Syntrophales bacterium]
MRGRTIAVGILLVILALVSGCGRQESKAQTQAQLPEVAVFTVQPKEVVVTTELTGRISANLVAEVRPQVGGIIKKRLFTEGSDVKAGQTLYQIDPATYQAALDNARAALGRSEANLPALRIKAARMKDLLAEKAVSQQDYDDVSAALNQAEADSKYWKAMVDTARINLRYTSVTAPISGRIGKSSVTEGALVTANQPAPLAVIQRLDPVYVDVPQSTTDLLQLRRRLAEGQINQNGRNKVRILLEDGSIYPMTGTLQFRDITVDPTTGSVMVRVVVPNPKGLLLPGMFVRAIVEEGVNRSAILVPQQGVSRTSKGEPVAMVVNADGKVEQRMLVLDRAVEDQWIIASGLVAGERLIVEGLQRVKPGAAVKTVPFKDAQEKKADAPPPAREKPEAETGKVAAPPAASKSAPEAGKASAPAAPAK